MFAPLAQGSIRPWSERGFFMLFSSFFGLHALPYRIFVMSNQLVNVVLVVLVARKLTRSELAGFLAPVFWMANASLATPMTWTSAYNEVQFATFLLLSFYLFLRYTETGQRKFYWPQWITFVLGFGALEINAVYPAIAALYALIFARRYLMSTLPMFAVSGAYALVHRIAAGSQQDFYYDMDFHVRALVKVFNQYWNILLGIPAFVHLHGLARWWSVSGVFLLTAAILGFVAWQAWQRQFLPLFLLGWFLIILSPLIPLHNHVTDYYVCVPAIGIAMLAAYAMSLAWQRGWAPTVLAAALALLYLIPSARMSRQAQSYNFEQSRNVRSLIQSVAYAKRIHAGKTILLKDVDSDLFYSAIYDSPFHIFGWNDVFVVPEARAHITEDPHMGPADVYFLPESAVAEALNLGSAEVYAIENRRLRNVTRAYTAMISARPAPQLPSAVDVGTAYFKDELGEGWFNLENGFRWSGKHAVIYMRGPASSGQKLYVHGFATEPQLALGPLHFSLAAGGHEEPAQVIDRTNSEFRFQYNLPDDLVGQPRIEIAFTLDRALHLPTDVRELGLMFGDFTIR